MGRIAVVIRAAGCDKTGSCKDLTKDFEDLQVAEQCRQLGEQNPGESQITTSTHHFDHAFAGETARCQRQFMFGRSCRISCTRWESSSGLIGAA